MILKNLHVVVVGTGILGASIAYHLTRLNVRVTIVEKAQHFASEATEKSFAWIVDNYNDSENSQYLRNHAIAEWHQVEKDFKGQMKINWSGSIMWRGNLSDTENTARELFGMGGKFRLLDRKELGLMEPNLKEIPEKAIFAPNEGSINPINATGLFLQAAINAGAEIQFSNEVVAFKITGSSIAGVITKNGSINSDLVVLAAGTQCAKLCEQLGINLQIGMSPSILMKIKTDRQFVNRIVSNPYMEIRAASSNLLLAAEDYIDESIENCPQAIAVRTVENIKKHWYGTGNITLKDVVVGNRPIPQDNLPKIGQLNNLEGLYVSVMHPGVTLAPIAGKFIADEIIHGQTIGLLNPYRLGRV